MVYIVVCPSSNLLIHLQLHPHTRDPPTFSTSNQPSSSYTDFSQNDIQMLAWKPKYILPLNGYSPNCLVYKIKLVTSDMTLTIVYIYPSLTLNTWSSQLNIVFIKCIISDLLLTKVMLYALRLMMLEEYECEVWELWSTQLYIGSVLYR